MIARLLRSGVYVNTRSQSGHTDVVLPFEAPSVVGTLTQRKCFSATEAHVVCAAWTASTSSKLTFLLIYENF